MLTTTSLISFLKAHEAFREKAYDDKQPKLDLNAGDEDKVKGKVTIGYGTTVYASGVKVMLGDTITEPRALDELTGYVRREVEPVLENLVHEPLTDDQYNALGSVVYNFGASEVSGWRLWGRINRRETGENIALEWLDGTWTSDGEPMEGLYKRRISEVLWFFGFDWRMAANASWSTSVLSMLRQLGWDGETPKAGPAHTPVEAEVDADIFDHDYDPTPETPMTTDDLNKRQLLRLRKPAPIGAKPLSANSRLPDEVPYGIADPSKSGMVPKEEAGRFIHAVEKEKGMEMEKQGKALAGVAGTVAVANTMSSDARALFSNLGQVGATLLAVIVFLAFAYMAVGWFRKRDAEKKELESEINATQGMF